MNALEKLEAVLCDPEGKCCIGGSDADRQIVNESLAALRAELTGAQPVQPAPQQAINAELLEALEAARQAISSMKNEAETAAVGDEPMMIYAAEQISNQGLAAELAIQAAIAKANESAP